jgi:hypothetical protein
LFLNADLDQLPSNLVTQRPGNGFQFRELGASREALGIKFSGQTSSDLAQAGVKLLANCSGILAHACTPLQITAPIEP